MAGGVGVVRSKQRGARRDAPRGLCLEMQLTMAMAKAHHLMDVMSDTGADACLVYLESAGSLDAGEGAEEGPGLARGIKLTLRAMMSVVG